MRKLKSILIAATAIPLIVAAAQAANRSFLNPASNSNFNTAANWSGNVAPVAGDTAIFGESDITVINFTADQTLAAMVFNPGSSDYTFGFNGAFDLFVNGAGISRNSDLLNGDAGTVFFNVNVANADILFNNASNASAGSLPVTYAVSNNGQIFFRNTSNGGNADLEIGPAGEVNFEDDSNAGSANILVQDGAFAGLFVRNNASLGSATVTNNEFVRFENNATAGSAAITNNDLVAFEGASTAGAATITNNSDGETQFFDTSSGGTSRQILAGTGILNISGLASAGTTFGSVEGDSNLSEFNLGTKNAEVGGNNHGFVLPNAQGERVVEYGGVISGVGGSLTKVGTGTWVLGGGNTYTGATQINQGILQIGQIINLGAGTDLIFNGGTLRVTNTLGLARNVNLLGNGVLELALGQTVTHGAGNTFTGAGNFTTRGGNLLFLGNKTHTGQTIIQNGSIQLGDGATAGNLTNTSGVVLQNGQLTFLPPADQIFDRNISGDGLVFVNGNNRVTFTGANTYEGVLAIIANASATAQGGNAIGNNTIVFITSAANQALIVQDNEAIGGLSGTATGSPAITIVSDDLFLNGDAFQNSQTFTGVIGGAGGIVKNGSFTQTLNGNHTYTRDTDVEGGKLIVNGSLASPDVFIDPGAEFELNGTGNDIFNDGTFSGAFNVTYLENAGTVSPGNSPGIGVTVNYVGVGAPTYTVDILANNQAVPVNGTTHDFLNITNNYAGEDTQLLLQFDAPSDNPVATTGNGIEVARVGNGAASAGNFFLADPNDPTTAQNQTNGFIGGFQYLVNFQNNTGPGGADQFFLRTVLREELVANAVALAAGRQLTRDCFRGVEHTQNGDAKGQGRTWVNGRYGTFEADASTGADFDSSYYCVNGGAEVALHDGFALGIRGGYANQEVDLN
ncbi:MAG TPA: hypothetical protein DCL48_12935, partial [Alphaproteobacteria bacterium]|nr:hypothetical protein [Alphaproteobacteria bacterium]